MRIVELIPPYKYILCIYICYLLCVTCHLSVKNANRHSLPTSPLCLLGTNLFTHKSKTNFQNQKIILTSKKRISSFDNFIDTVFYHKSPVHAVPGAGQCNGTNTHTETDIANYIFNQPRKGFLSSYCSFSLLNHLQNGPASRSDITFL